MTRTGLIGISVRRILLTLIPRRRIIALIISVANSEIPIAFDHRVAFSSQWHKSQLSKGGQIFCIQLDPVIR